MIYLFSIQNMQSGNRRTSKNRIIFPHPILKSFQPTPSTHLQSSYAYQPVTQPSQTASSISGNIVRTSHHQPVVGTTFGILVHPLHPTATTNIPKLSYNPVNQKCVETGKIKKCQNCNTILTPSTMTQYHEKCIMCGNSLSYLHHSSQNIVSNLIFDITTFEQITHQKLSPHKFSPNKKMLFVIEANEHLYATSIHKIIFDVVRAFRPSQKQSNDDNITNFSSQGQSLIINQQEMQIGFVLYNNTQAYFINLQSQQINIVQPSQFDKCSIPNMPVPCQQLFKSISQIGIDDIEDIVQNIMYQEYYHSHSCLQQLLDMLSMLHQQIGVEISVFAHHIPTKFNKTKQYHQSIQLHILNDKYLDINTCFSKHRLFGESSNTSNTSKSKNVDLTAINIDKLYNITKVYSHQHTNYNQVYYDLYNQINRQGYYDVQCSVGTSSPFIKFQSSVQKGKKVLTDNTISHKLNGSKNIINFTEINGNQNILFDFEVSSVDIPKKSIIYLQFDFKTKNKISAFKRVIIIPIPEPILKTRLQSQYINDETSFYSQFLRTISQHTTNNNKKTLIVKKNKKLHQNQRIQKENKFTDILPYSHKNYNKYEDPINVTLREKIKEQISSYFSSKSEKPSKNQCNIPLNFSHTLLYLYILSKHSMIMQNPGNGSMCFTQFARSAINQGLETFVKDLYPKVYQIKQQQEYFQLKFRKFKPETFTFQKSPLLIIDDGRNINLIVDEDYTHKLKHFFNTSNLQQIIQYTQIPEINDLPLNIQIRQLIRQLRQYNHLYYLPLKVLVHGSKEFDNKFSNYFYTDNQHYRYLQKMLKQIISI